MNNIKSIKTTALICFIILSAGCSKTTVVVECNGHGGNGNGSSPENNGQNALITFNASIENRVPTRSISLMKEGIYNQLFAFDAAKPQNSAASPAAQGVYITSAPGVLTGYSGYKMYLPDGIYDFYGVSDNMNGLPTKFVNGQSEPLFNGIDYLWWHSPQQDIAGSRISIPIVYAHAATQIVFEISGGNGIKLSSLLSATITPPATGAAMDLFTGNIPPATEYDTQIDKMGINGFIAQYIMLPFKSTVPMTLSIDVILVGETDSRAYTVQVPLPGGELKAGNSYLFSAVLNANEILFPQVSIKDWTEVDETGNPLYPKQ